MTDALLPDERIDELAPYGLCVVQNTKWFRFGTDSVLLAHFAAVKPQDVVLDLGTGSGVIALLLMGRYSPKKIVGVEIQENMARMAQKSIRINGLDDRIEIINGDFTDKHLIPAGKYDHVVSNPPYLRTGLGDMNAAATLRIARHEVSATLGDVVSAASRSLRNGGRFSMVHIPSRIDEIIYVMSQNKLFLKRIKLVQPFAGKSPNLVLVEGVKNAKPGVKWEPTLCVYKADGIFSDDMEGIYAGSK